jgi:hypothetical protein
MLLKGSPDQNRSGHGKSGDRPFSIARRMAGVHHQASPQIMSEIKFRKYNFHHRVIS